MFVEELIEGIVVAFAIFQRVVWLLGPSHFQSICAPPIRSGYMHLRSAYVTFIMPVYGVIHLMQIFIDAFHLITRCRFVHLQLV